MHAEGIMRKVADGYERALCAMKLDVEPAEVPRVMFHAAGGKPNVRVITVNGREVHRCEVRSGMPASASDSSRIV